MRSQNLAKKLARAQAAAERLATSGGNGDAERAVAYVNELNAILGDRLAVLRAAAVLAGLLPGQGSELPPNVAMDARGYVGYLQATPDSHQVVLFVLARWDELMREAEAMRTAIDRGAVSPELVASFRIKSLFPTKLPLFFSRHVPLAEIFTDAASELGKASPSRLRDRAVIRTLNPGGKSGTLILLRPKLNPEALNVVEEARAMVRDLDRSMRVFEAVCDPSPENVQSLDPRSRDRAAALATALLSELERRDKLIDYVATFERLRKAVAKGPFATSELRDLMLHMSGLPADFEGVELVEAILG